MYSLRNVLSHKPTEIAAAVAGALNIAAGIAAMATHADLGPIIATCNAALLPILVVLVVAPRVVATAPLQEFAGAVAEAEGLAAATVANVTRSRRAAATRKRT